jgi:hypothetical protein
VKILIPVGYYAMLCRHVDYVICPYFPGSTSVGLLDFKDEGTLSLRMSVTTFQSVRRTIP